MTSLSEIHINHFLSSKKQVIEQKEVIKFIEIGKPKPQCVLEGSRRQVSPSRLVMDTRSV
jgi:hypothetical protein